MSVQIMVPSLGESVSEATVLKWFKNVGEAVEADEADGEVWDGEGEQQL